MLKSQCVVKHRRYVQTVIQSPRALEQLGYDEGQAVAVALEESMHAWVVQRVYYHQLYSGRLLLLLMMVVVELLWLSLRRPGVALCLGDAGWKHQREEEAVARRLSRNLVRLVLAAVVVGRRALTS